MKVHLEKKIQANPLTFIVVVRRRRSRAGHMFERTQLKRNGYRLQGCHSDWDIWHKGDQKTHEM